MSPYKISELDLRGIVLADLTPREKRTLDRVRDQVGVEWHADGSVRVYSKGNIGSVTLSPATTIQITPKLPVRCLLSLASLAFRTLPIPSAVEETLASSAEPLIA